MARPRRLPLRPKNQLLAALPLGEYRRFQPHLRPVPLRGEQVLAAPGELFSHAYFPTTGAISVVVMTAESGCVVIGMVGKEGMVGLPILFDSERSPIRVMVHSPGEALALPTDILRQEIDRGSVFHSLLLRYTDTFLNMVMHTAACNHFHAVEQRLACWLLLTRDRLETNEFFLTQRLLGQMLGVRRISITPVARKMQQAGLIRYRRGRLTLLNCSGLEKLACSCYPLLRARFDALRFSQRSSPQRQT